MRVGLRGEGVVLSIPSSHNALLAHRFPSPPHTHSSPISLFKGNPIQSALPPSLTTIRNNAMVESQSSLLIEALITLFTATEVEASRALQLAS